jgi:hypothetical protein
MTKGDIAKIYRNMSAEDRRTFDRWVKANAVAASVLAAGLVAMSLAGSHALGPRQAAANSTKASEFSASEKRHAKTEPMSAYELMGRFAPDQLPVLQVDEPF